MSGNMLRYPVTQYNQTTRDCTPPPKTTDCRAYFLDVNPWSRDHERGNVQNIIDAR